MAKKAKTEGILARATRQKAEDEAVVAAARQAEADARAAKDAERATAEAAEATKQAAAGSGRKRAAMAGKAEPAAKKARYVREKKEATPEAEAAPLPPRSTTASGKMLSKNVKTAPKETAGPNRGPERRRDKPQ